MVLFKRFQRNLKLDCHPPEGIEFKDLKHSQIVLRLRFFKASINLPLVICTNSNFFYSLNIRKHPGFNSLKYKINLYTILIQVYYHSVNIYNPLNWLEKIFYNSSRNGPSRKRVLKQDFIVFLIVLLVSNSKRILFANSNLNSYLKKIMFVLEEERVGIQNLQCS